MRKSLKMFFVGAMFACPTLSMGQQLEDIKEAIVDHFDRHFVGLQAHADNTWDRTSCTVREPLTGSCLKRIGDKTYGIADIEITDALQNSGSAVHLILPEFGINIIKTDLFMSYEYNGTSSGKKQCYPGNFFCGWDWESLHPAGRIEIRLRADSGTSFGMWVNYYVYPGHDDKSNGLAKAAAESLKPKTVEIMKQFLSVRGIPVEVILRN